MNETRSFRKRPAPSTSPEDEAWLRIQSAARRLFGQKYHGPLAQVLKLDRTQIHRWRRGKVQDVRGRLHQIADFLEAAIHAAGPEMPLDVLGRTMVQVAETSVRDVEAAARLTLKAAELIESHPTFGHLISRAPFTLSPPLSPSSP